MHFESFFIQSLIYLAAAVAAITIGKKLGIGSVLGYLIAGAIIGPHLLGLIGGDDGKDVMHFAEFGVVMMLFVIGLELRPSALWKMRGDLLGAGASQVLVTSLILAILAVVLLGTEVKPAIAIGLIFALSSTAIAVQTLSEKGLLPTQAGRRSFSVLLFQDIAVIPIIALLPLLASDASTAHSASDHATTWTASLSPWAQAIVTLSVVVAIIAGGYFFTGRALRIVAKTGSREAFTAAALLLVVAIATLMSKVGLSPALGTFIAGVVLSESEYRHELESDLEPVKGLLLALFFIAIGAGIDFGLISANPIKLILATIALLVVKATVLAAIGKLTRMSFDQNAIFTVSLAQGGEFAFVLLSLAASRNILDPTIIKELTVVVTISMAMTPLLFLLLERLVLPRIGTREDDRRAADEIHELNNVIIAGFGRFGNVVGRFLQANGISTTVLEHDSDHVDFVRKLGIKAYYGDARRRELLAAAGAEKAAYLILAIDNADESIQIVHLAKKHFPNLHILARAVSRDHAYRLIDEGIDDVFIEQQASALECGAALMRHLGYRARSTQRAAECFQQFDNRAIRELANVRDDKNTYIDHARARIAELESYFDQNAESASSQHLRGWDPRSRIEAVRKSKTK